MAEWVFHRGFGHVFETQMTVLGRRCELGFTRMQAVWHDNTAQGETLRSTNIQMMNKRDSASMSEIPLTTEFFQSEGNVKLGFQLLFQPRKNRRTMIDKCVSDKPPCGEQLSSLGYVRKIYLEARRAVLKVILKDTKKSNRQRGQSIRALWLLDLLLTHESRQEAGRLNRGSRVLRKYKFQELLKTNIW